MHSFVKPRVLLILFLVILLQAGQSGLLRAQENGDPDGESVQAAMPEKAGTVGRILAFTGGINALQLDEDERQSIAEGLIDCLQSGETPTEVRQQFQAAYQQMQARFNVLTNQTGEPEPFSGDIAYTIGHMTGQFSELAGYAFSPDELNALKAGFLGNLDEKEPSPELLASWDTVSEYLNAKEAAFVEAEQAANRARRAAFFEELATREGVESDPSGLHWEVVEPGEGSPPSMADTVTVHYKGSLVDGTVFDSSYERGEPATFSMRGVIPGFSMGLSKVAPGGKVNIYIPADLGYGDNPPSASGIRPGDTLIFECELISIDRADPPPAAPAPGDTSMGG